MSKFEWQVTHSLSDALVKDILTTAIEGGIGYWACLDNDTPEWKDARKRFVEKNNGQKPYYCDVAFELMVKGDPVVFLDEQDDDKELKMYYDDFVRGCKLFEQHSNVVLSDYIENGAFDAIDADCIIQYAVFGDIIYG